MYLDLKKCDLCRIQVLSTSLQNITIEIPLEGEWVKVPNIMACTDCRKDIEDAGNE